MLTIELLQTGKWDKLAMQLQRELGRQQHCNVDELYEKHEKDMKVLWGDCASKISKNIIQYIYKNPVKMRVSSNIPTALGGYVKMATLTWLTSPII